ncbi:PD40 domain-containing protein [Promethearchaeum syntrophicum]|uniref:PD40 domain-containing protein n=1 Tax=Promethearchaeum syntrophicum TaxID=2594042 RepID=A0A5B9DH83_9ARCH|nr:PD40 domain-containing protein [Candidatus Prometheoarchaeum syntrophicum]QEE18076.1 WD40-like Beta Propeller Repeat protein [Candidatus Prometheoarchaeum syntrophicum]
MSDVKKEINIGGKVATCNMLESIAFSPKFEKVIHFEFPDTIIKTPNNEKLCWLMINNKKIRQHDFLKAVPEFSTDGEHFSYIYHTFPIIGKDGTIEFGVKQSFIQIDEKNYGPYENIHTNAVFSPDNKKFAFVAEKEHENAQFGGGLTSLVTITQHGIEKHTHNLKMFVVIDGVEQQDYIHILKPPIFSPNSKRFAYPAIKGDIKQKSHDKISGDTNQIVNQLWNADPYANKRQVWVIDGKESPEFDGLSMFLFSPDSQHYAFIGRRGKQYFVVHDDIESEAYFSCGSLTFNPITQDLAYSVRFNEQNSAIYYQEKYFEKQFYLIGKQGLKFSNDGKHMGYAGNNLKNQWKLMVDDEEHGWFDGIGGDAPVFSPDGKRLAYFVVRGGKQYMCIDGKFDGPYDGFVSSVVFSPDSNHYAYAGKLGNVIYIVVDGKKNSSYMGSYNDIFYSEDSKHVVFVVNKKVGAKLYNCVLIDDMEGPIFTRIFNNGKNSVKFTQNDSILYYAVQKEGENYNVNLVETSYNIPTKFCNQCGTRITNVTNKFCGKCGNCLS